MSLPLRFKAVCTETGREFYPDDQGLDEKNIDPWLERKTKNLYSWAVQAWIPVKHTKLTLCQSTGLKDSQGKEVFFGDVLLIYFPETDTGYFYSVYFERAGFKLEGFYLPEQVRPQGQRHWLSVELLLDFIEDGKKVFVVGNKWEPIETLKQRAEELTYEHQD